MRVPAEFLGAAREIRRKSWLADERINVGLPRLLEPLERRLRMKTTIRPWQFQAALETWDKLADGDFRMHRDAQFANGKFEITQARLGASKWTGKDWQEDEFEAAPSGRRARDTVGGETVAPHLHASEAATLSQRG